MTSFATHRRKVHDGALPAHRRMSALRTCLTEFAPYGFRATFHHLRGSAGIPRNPAHDPDSLVRAVEELQAAREVWVPGILAWQEARRVQKRAGVRRPDPPAPQPRAWCPNPEFHPLGPLAEVMPRVLRAREYAGRGCPVCEADHSAVSWSDGHGVHRLCAHCGVQLGWTPQAVDDVHRRSACASRWRAVWRGDAEWERPPRA
ncbi:hypothetical protein [Streptomyces sp. H34-S4]|uniref:hypothetical protein n=1 Tax=Streptomyces sp. H34-S4 TaxID=2996463 RepID=UPI00226EB172|nr:hypothetical protein [Streptomyces sp. H34-S4]MCY0936472.1 hypothetical protein [Streptomyces sp. H34-S4]